ncbi:zeta toxin family protein [Massilia rubra]|uniref:AAA family ATPase n=1 Tax=Massilia rubra TaxID=2607910 RepID=A0ABX0LL85_9BURK|nr:zeta toxin family protein [Massilia rubra]NHZ35363.1 AAA family ATPase [Massilia rubra]
MSQSEKREEYDIAESRLHLLISYYSQCVYKEEHKAIPDMKQIAQWENEKRSLMALARALELEDQAAIADINATYGPVLRACKALANTGTAPPYELDKAEHDRLYALIARDHLSCVEPQDKPMAIITGGQPGSGKGTLTAQAKQEFATQGGYVLVDPNELRLSHPAYFELMSENDREAADLTHSDASTWAKRLTSDAIDGRRNLIIDQTSKNADSLVALTTRLSEAGYHVELRVMAVNPELSYLRTLLRYENQKAQEGMGRFVPKNVHDAAYEGLPDSVEAVERAKSANAVKVYRN